MGSVIGAVVSGIYQEDSNIRSLKSQQIENQLNRQFNAQEAEKARQFTAQERLAQQEYQSAEWDRQQAYNTPAMQAQRLREGGINPAVYFSGSSMASSGSVSAPSGSPGSPASYNQGVSPYSVQLPSFGDIGQFVKDIADARKSASETRTEDVMRDPLYRKAMEELLGAQMANQLTKLEVAFQEANFPKRVEKYEYDVANAGMQLRLAQSEEDLKIAQTAYYQAMEALQYAIKDETSTKALIAKNELANWDSTYKTYLAERKSEIEKNKAQAQEARASAQNQKAQAALNNWESKWREKTEGWRKDEFFESLEGLRKDNAIKAWQEQTAQAAYKIQQNAADHAEALFWKDFIIDIVNSGVDAFTSIKNSRSWENLSDASQRRVDVNLERMRHEFGDKVEVRTPNSRGGTTTKTYRRPYQKYGSSKD